MKVTQVQPYLRLQASQARTPNVPMSFFSTQAPTISTDSLTLTLRHNDKRVYEVPGSASLLERIALFFGSEVRDNLYALDTTQGPAHLL